MRVSCEDVLYPPAFLQVRDGSTMIDCSRFIFIEIDIRPVDEYNYVAYFKEGPKQWIRVRRSSKAHRLDHR